MRSRFKICSSISGPILLGLLVDSTTHNQELYVDTPEKIKIAEANEVSARFAKNATLTNFTTLRTMTSAIVSIEFEVFGQIQGCFFTKYLKEECDNSDISGWIKVTKRGTVFGIIQGTKSKIEHILTWLKTGCPGSKIDRCETKNYTNLSKPEFRGFSVRF